MKDEEKKVLTPADAATHLRPGSDLPPDADVEERFNEFWKKYGVFIFGAIGAIAVVVLVSQVFNLLQKQSEAGMQAAYQEATASDARIVFAQENAKHRLGGLAYLAAADAEFAEGAFLQAGSHYEAALAGLSDSPLAGRARLGMAISRLRQGDASGLALLEDLARDASVLQVVRAEAAYHHAVATWERGDLQAAERSLTLLASFQDAPEWQRAGDRLADEIPGIDLHEGHTHAGVFPGG